MELAREEGLLAARAPMGPETPSFKYYKTPSLRTSKHEEAIVNNMQRAFEDRLRIGFKPATTKSNKCLNHCYIQEAMYLRSSSGPSKHEEAIVNNLQEAFEDHLRI